MQLVKILQAHKNLKNLQNLKIKHFKFPKKSSQCKWSMKRLVTLLQQEQHFKFLKKNSPCKWSMKRLVTLLQQEQHFY